MFICTFSVDIHKIRRYFSADFRSFQKILTENIQMFFNHNLSAACAFTDFYCMTKSRFIFKTALSADRWILTVCFAE